MTLIDPHSIDGPRTASVSGIHGRDAGKLFQVAEMLPLDTANYVLRLMAAIRADGVADLMELLEAPTDGAVGAGAVESVLRLLAGCDAVAVGQLMKDALYSGLVSVAPDPQHPGMFRPLRADDIREMKTLGDVFGAFLRLNVTSG